MITAADLSAKPIYHHVDGAPVQPRQIVRVIAAIDSEIADVAGHIGRLGLVEYLEYECGCGQSFPANPMVGLRFTSGAREEFWPEEIEVVR
jgi:hypothetical protein